MSRSHSLTAILPCNDLAASEAFYAKLGFTHREGPDEYRMLSDGRGGEIHLQAAVEGWLIPGAIRSGCICILRMLTNLPSVWVAKRKLKNGACTSLCCRTRMRRWCEWGGRLGYAREIPNSNYDIFFRTI